MVGKKRKAEAEAEAKAAPQLPRLPDELWEKIFRYVAYGDRGANIATLRLVNKECANRFMFTQYQNTLKVVTRRKRRQRRDELTRTTDLMAAEEGTDMARQLRMASIMGVYSGRAQGDLQMERFIWELCKTYAASRDTAERMSKCRSKKMERVLFLKASMEALRAMGF